MAKLTKQVPMKLKSFKDKKPSFNTSDLAEFGVTTKDEKLLVEIFVGGVVRTVSFHASRGGKTFYPETWESGWPLPKRRMDGPELMCEIRSVEKIKNTF